MQNQNKHKNKETSTTNKKNENSKTTENVKQKQQISQNKDNMFEHINEKNIPQKSNTQQNQKNLKTLGTMRGNNKTYAEAVKQGSRTTILQKTIKTLISCLQELQETDVLSDSETDTNGKNTSGFNRRSNTERKQC
jgi:hypothetical protein